MYLTDEDARELPTAGKVFDLAVYMSFIRHATATKLALRYSVCRDTIYRYFDLLEQIYHIPIIRMRGVGISVEDGWYFGEKPLSNEQKGALLRAINETNDENQKELLRSIL